MLGPLALAAAVALAGCHGVSVGLGPTSTHGSHEGGTTTATVAAAGPVSAGSGALTVLSEPQAGLKVIDKLITGARSSIELTMYTLRDTTAESDLAAAAKRGVAVRVILDQHLEKKFNTATYSYLKAHKVQVTWAPSGVTYHQKTLTVDNKTSVIMTLNMNSGDYAGTRDFAVIDTNKQDVDAIVTTFKADFAHKKTSTYTPPDGADLVWSPTNSQAAILAVIDAARHTLSVENEEMADTVIISALEADAKRGVAVRITMTKESEWDDAFSALEKAGAHVRLYKNSTKVIYIHAKVVIADAGASDEQMFVGSENFSSASLRRNRELGLRTTNKSVIGAVDAVLAADYKGATPY
jgi:phosphatidylserine/phosphatidylglycerophosphate/cardiolipin synthase-like enzyme